MEAALWAHFPARQRRIERITPAGLAGLSGGIGGSHGTDVTGGMRSTVEEMVQLVRQIPHLTVEIFSWAESGSVDRALGGHVLGTLTTSD